MTSSTEMVQQEHGISYDGEEAKRESSKNVKPDKVPQRGPGIAELEKLRREEPHKRFSAGNELVLHTLRRHLNPTVPFLPGFDPKSSLGYYVENFAVSPSELLDSSPLGSSDGTVPLLWSSFQSDDSSSPNPHLSLVASEVKQPLRGPQLPLPLQQQEQQQLISQVMKYSSVHSVPGTGLQMELEPPSNQSRYGVVNALPWADKQMMMHQIVGMKRPWPFQKDPAQSQWVIVPEPIPTRPKCETMINGAQEKTTDWSKDGALSLRNVGVNLNSTYPTVERNIASEEDVAAPIEDSPLSLVCLPSASSSVWPQKTMSIRQSSEMNFTKRQKKTKEGTGRKTSTTPSEALGFYNFMGLPLNDYVADPYVIAKQNKRSWGGSDAVDVDLKL